jgi:hypothetical protein
MPALGMRNALCDSLLIMGALASVARAQLPADPAAVTPLPVRLGADELWKAAAPFARVSGRSVR